MNAYTQILDQVSVPDVGPGHVLVRNRAIGVNFHDTYCRSGLYPSSTGLPFVVGLEGAGEIEGTGQRVAYAVGYLTVHNSFFLKTPRKIRLIMFWCFSLHYR